MRNAVKDVDLTFCAFCLCCWIIFFASPLILKPAHLRIILKWTVQIYLNIPNHASRIEGHPSNSQCRMSIDFRQGKVDLFAVQRYFSDKILGPDPAPASESAAIMTGVQDKGSGSPLAWMGDDSRMVRNPLC